MTLSITFTSDVICPWCMIGLKRLESALETFPQLDYKIIFLPFQLDATLPKQGVDKLKRLAEKFGPERVSVMMPRMKQIGLECGISFAENGILANTFSAHALLYKAKQDGIQYKTKVALLEAYHEKGLSLGDYNVLADCFQSAGGDRAEALEFLGKYGDIHKETLAEIGDATKRGIHGVPFIVLQNNGKSVEIEGGQPIEQFVKAITSIL